MFLSLRPEMLPPGYGTVCHSLFSNSFYLLELDRQVACRLSIQLVADDQGCRDRDGEPVSHISSNTIEEQIFNSMLMIDIDRNIVPWLCA
ncbi:unnamed protein product [Calypogeia fissa]